MGSTSSDNDPVRCGARLESQREENYEKPRNANFRAHGCVHGNIPFGLSFAICSRPGLRESSLYESSAFAHAAGHGSGTQHDPG
jgi:hypothetical protein